jgi:DNA-binding MarR family transcriptional regulator
MTTASSVFDRLLEITLLLQQDLAQSFAGTALTPSRTHLLWAVHQQGPSTQQSLARALDVSPRNVTGLVDALAGAGYVERRPHPDDRRATLVTLTALGAETMTRMEREREEAADALVAGLSRGEVTELDRQLGRLAERLHTMIDTPTPGAS